MFSVQVWFYVFIDRSFVFPLHVIYYC